MNNTVNDPLFHFETHFPERLSRLHLNPDFAGGSHPAQRKGRRSRARMGGRYKTQPVTFDEIQEVDEENIKEPEVKTTEGLKHQFAAFSKSMDGLVPKFRNSFANDTIQEVDDTDSKQNTVKNGDNERVCADKTETRLQGSKQSETEKENKENDPQNGAKSEMSGVPGGLPPSGLNTRRQRTTAKAKRRQMQAESQSGGESGT